MKKMRIAAMLAVMAIVLGFGYAAPKSDVADVVTVFDPATYKGGAGEVVEINGEKYLKVVTKEYGNRIYIDPVSLKGKKTFSAVMFGEKADPESYILLTIMDISDGETWKYISLISTEVWEGGIPATPTIKRSGVATAKDHSGESWFKPSKSMLCTEIDVGVKKPSDNYNDQYGVTVYIGKITAF